MLNNETIVTPSVAAAACRLCGSDKTRRGPGAGQHHGRLLATGRPQSGEGQ
jgi:hypothetical protein